MELRHLRYFVAVAEHLHFGRAAKVLGTAQPSLSQQIRKLESDVGTRLLERSRHSVRLTAAGVVFQREARAVLSAAERSISLALDAAAGQLGRLRIACVAAATSGSTAERVRSFTRAYPGVDVSVRVLSNRAVFERLAADEIDLAVADCAPDLRVSSLGLQEKLIERQRLVVALPKGHRLAAGDGRVDVAALRGERLVAFALEENETLARTTSALYREYAFEASAVFEVAEESSVLLAVASGIGIALIPSGWASLGNPLLIFKEIEPSPDHDLVAYWRRDSSNASLHEFLE